MSITREQIITLCNLALEAFELRAENERLRAAASALLDEAEDVFVCMADATGINRHNFPEPFIRARAALERKPE
jgi:hypothetical protein